MTMTQELVGLALDFAIAQCEQLPIRLDPMGFRNDAPEVIQAGYWIWGDGYPARMQLIGHDYTPSSHREQGGEIVERENISNYAPGSEHGEPDCWTATSQDGVIRMTGETMLIASMRVYVFSKLGANPELPASVR
ncbi:phage protein NinX family protein [Aliagarivorans taiwanensis]|uniref:phage protein NinX family protein n=1 Tax=Aliagarivorans taiwanensis TaxID=561966 RepID=UPI0006865BFE|nr:phage protein NinX family protein [Aliagarivorans taiwanensis]